MTMWKRLKSLFLPRNPGRDLASIRVRRDRQRIRARCDEMRINAGLPPVRWPEL